MNKLQDFVWLLFIGSLWGLNEIVAGEFLYSKEIPYASVWLSGFALFLLAIGRGLVNRAGSSTAIGGVASLYRLVNAGPFVCHLLAIFILGLVFDLASTALTRPLKIEEDRLPFIGMAAAYGSNGLFAFLITYIIRYPYWVSGGLAKVLDHFFLSGSLTALASIFLVPAGFLVGRKSEISFLRQPRWTVTGVLFVTLLFWVTGWMVG